MRKIGRNEACPCGSGKKFKNCHMGREEELWAIETQRMKEEIGEKIASLPEVDYGSAKAFSADLDLRQMSGNDGFQGIRFIDFDTYVKLESFDKGNLENVDHRSGALIVNPKKTESTDPKHIYMAITPDIDDSSLIHELAHILDFLDGSGLLPGSTFEIGTAMHIPMDQLDHLKEYGDWLDYLADRFYIQLNAEDMIISYLNKHDMLIEASVLKNKDIDGLLARSRKMTAFLVNKKREINELIKDRIGYLGGTASA